MRALVGFTFLTASALALAACNGSSGDAAANNSETVDTTVVPDDEGVAAENASGNETANASDDKGSDDRGSDDRGSDDRGSDDRGSDDR